MKKPIISAILSMFVFSNQLYAQSSDFRTGNYDYSKIKSGDQVDILDSYDQSTLSFIVSDQVLRYNLEQMLAKSYRSRSEPVVMGKTAPFLARIQSSYYDEVTKKWEVVRGLGTFVKMKINGVDRSAVLSVSHLTQGQQLRIYDSKDRLLAIQPEMRLANVDQDIELIVLKDQVETPIVEQYQGFFSTPVLDLNSGVLAEGLDVFGYDRMYVSKKQHVPILKSLLPKNSAGHTIYTFTQGREDIFRKFVKQKKYKNVLQASDEERIKFFSDIWDEDGLLQKQLVGGGYIAGARMLPGLSGAPLIRDIPDAFLLRRGVYLYYLDGLVQGHHRFENKSYFVGLSSIVKIMKDFREGRRNYTSQTRWRVKNRMTFRDYGNGVLEANIIKAPSASFYKSDSGNAISVDGDFNPSTGGFGIGMQDGRGNNIVGQFVKIEGLTLPVLADPSLKNGLPKGMESKDTFGASQDLWKLAKMKYEFRDQMVDYITQYECFYQVTDTGIDLQINKFMGDNMLKWHGEKSDLQKGFGKNDLVIREKNKAPVEISGLFFTDLTNVVDTGNPKTAGAPTVTVLPFNGAEPQRLGCLESPAQRKAVYNNLRKEISTGFGEILGKEMPMLPSPFGN